jgi:hypothetical protein
MTRSLLLIPAAVLILGVAAYAASSHSNSHKSGSKSGSASGPAQQVSLSPVQRAELAFSKDAGAAFTTFYQAIYTPYQQGAFKSAKSNPQALASAGQAAAEASQEIHAAAVATTESPQLAPLRAPMKALDQGFKAALVKLKQGHFDFGEIQAAAVAISSIRGAAASAGLTIPS